MKVSQLDDRQRRSVQVAVFSPAAIAAGLALLFLGMYIASLIGFDPLGSKDRKGRKPDDTTSQTVLLALVVIGSIPASIYAVFSARFGLAALREGVCVPATVSGRGVALWDKPRNVWVTYAYGGVEYETRTSAQPILYQPFADGDPLTVVVVPRKPKAGIVVWSPWPER